MKTREKTNGVSRRGFIGAVGAATAAAALPVGALAVGTAKRTNDRHGVMEPPADALEALRAYYVAAVAAVAAELRPRFESGELHGWREEDSRGMDDDRKGFAPSPWRVEGECGERFVRGSMQRAYLVLAVSPSEVETFDGACADPRYHAAQAMAWDVIRFARAQGWTALAQGEDAPGAIPGAARYYGGEPFHGWGRRYGQGEA
jgi:hypothetical protein